MVIIELAIGLMFIYLLFSLLISTLNEIVARFTQHRGTLLRQSMGELLECDDFRDRLYDHPLISGLKLGSHYPTYIPASNFALAVMNLEALSSGENKDLVRKPHREYRRKRPCGPASSGEVV
jgi:hypothetical protein